MKNKIIIMDIKIREMEIIKMIEREVRIVGIEVILKDLEVQTQKMKEKITIVTDLEVLRTETIKQTLTSKGLEVLRKI